MAKRQKPLLWSASRAAIKKYDVPYLLHNSVIFTPYKKFTNVAASCITQPGGPGSGDTWSMSNVKLHISQTFSVQFIYVIIFLCLSMANIYIYIYIYIYIDYSLTNHTAYSEIIFLFIFFSIPSVKYFKRYRIGHKHLCGLLVHPRRLRIFKKKTS